MAKKLKQITRELAREERTGEVAQIMSIHTRGVVPMACVYTYGCQQNVADEEEIKGQLEQMDSSLTEDEDETGLIPFNTYTTREHAEDRVFSSVGAFKNVRHHNPSLIVAVYGCMMEQEHVAGRMKKSFPFVNLVFGTHVIHKLPELMFRTLTDGWRMFEHGDDSEDRTIMEGLPIRRDGSFKAWVTVMYGCNSFCSYCIVPYVRGRERSRRSEAIFEEVRSLVSAGYRDITLLGQNVNSYDKELTPTISLVELLRQPDAIDEGFQLRFMTSHPEDVTHKLIDTIAQSRHISHHLHLPFRSGSSRILKAVSRSYTREKYLDLVAYAKEKIPDLSLTSDIIVGFPGETYEEFCETVSLIKEVEFTSLFTFIYLPRIDTRIAELPDPASYEGKSRWFRESLAAQEEIAAKHCAEMVGTVQRVLAEERSSKIGHLAGRSGGSIIVELDGGDGKIGEFCQVRVTTARNWILNGELA